MNQISQLELVTSVNVRYSNTSGSIPLPVYHFLYASQVYDTLFGLYGKFNGGEITYPDGRKAFKVDQISLVIENYKGSINIGFADRNPVWGSDDGKIFIKFYVVGGSNNVSKDYNPVPFDVPEDGRFQIDFSRVLDPMPEFDKYFKLRIGPGGIDPAERKLEGEPPLSQYFDTEFNERDGLDFYNRRLRPGMLGYDDVRLAGHRCNTSRVNLFF